MPRRGCKPAKGRVNEQFAVTFTAANIGYHASPSLQLLAAGDEGNAVAEPTKRAINEGGARLLSGSVAFGSVGQHKIVALAELGTFGNVLVKKSLPPEGVTQEPIATVNVSRSQKRKHLANRNKDRDG